MDHSAGDACEFCRDLTLEDALGLGHTGAHSAYLPLGVGDGLPGVRPRKRKVWIKCSSPFNSSANTWSVPGPELPNGWKQMLWRGGECPYGPQEGLGPGWGAAECCTWSQFPNAEPGAQSTRGVPKPPPTAPPCPTERWLLRVATGAQGELLAALCPLGEQKWRPDDTSPSHQAPGPSAGEGLAQRCRKLRSYARPALGTFWGTAFERRLLSAQTNISELPSCQVAEM